MEPERKPIQSQMPGGAAEAPPPGEQVWDLFVRVFHWSLVSCVLLNQFVLEEEGAPHRWIGYLASALVLARIVWGFIGTRHARFADFFPTPARIKHHVSLLRQGKHEDHAGHNPLGALMMLALMALILALGFTGWLHETDVFWGEEWLQETHEFLAHALITLAFIHAVAAIVMGRIERTRLVRAMVTGVKERY